MSLSVKPAPRHQCLFHDGASPRQLSALATVARAKLEQNYRCMYFDSFTAIAEMRRALEAAGVHVEREVVEGRLLLCPDRKHLAGSRFDPERMMRALEAAYDEALNDGFEGLWGSGDMAWELGPRMDYAGLLEYEQRLERFMEENTTMSGVCQYHVSTLSRAALRHGLLTHQSLFVSENLSMVNPYFLEPQSSVQKTPHPLLLDAAIGRLCAL